MVKAKKIVYARPIEGEPTLSDFQITEEEVPPLQDGQVLCETLWVSVDPYIRAYGHKIIPGDTVIGGVVARIVESKAPAFPKGRNVVGYFGWRTKTIFDAKDDEPSEFPKPYLLPDFGNLPLSLGVGALGMPGVTAYFTFKEVCDPKAGETVVINGAAGAVGSLLGQMAKFHGCRVIGFAGSEEKIKWLTEELGFDAVYNYKKTSVVEALKESAPNGVDCFFDNVGGESSNHVMQHMNRRGRVCVIGAIVGYNAGYENVLAPIVQPYILFKELKVEGFIVWSHAERWSKAIAELLRWIQEGKLKYRETVTDGFENTPRAFIGMLRGENFGKAVVKA